MPLMAYLADAGDPVAAAAGSRADGVHPRLPHHPGAVRRRVHVPHAGRQLPGAPPARRHDALLLAQRWSQVAAVLFAVGAVSGTVLSFELGLLWPGSWAASARRTACRSPSRASSSSSRRSSSRSTSTAGTGCAPWAHFWSGVPVVLSGLGGTFSVVAANAWMNPPGGHHRRAAARSSTSIPVEVFFNGAFWYEAIHMFLAAYVVAGFIVAGVYARHAEGAARPLPPARAS